MLQINSQSTICNKYFIHVICRQFRILLALMCDLDKKLCTTKLFEFLITNRTCIHYKNQVIITSEKEEEGKERGFAIHVRIAATLYHVK